MLPDTTNSHSWIVPRQLCHFKDWKLNNKHKMFSFHWLLYHAIYTCFKRPPFYFTLCGHIALSQREHGYASWLNISTTQPVIALDKEEWKFHMLCDLCDTVTITQPIIFCSTKTKFCRLRFPDAKMS